MCNKERRNNSIKDVNSVKANAPRVRLMNLIWGL